MLMRPIGENRRNLACFWRARDYRGSRRVVTLVELAWVMGPGDSKPLIIAKLDRLARNVAYQTQRNRASNLKPLTFRRTRGSRAWKRLKCLDFAGDYIQIKHLA